MALIVVLFDSHFLVIESLLSFHYDSFFPSSLLYSGVDLVGNSSPFVSHRHVFSTLETRIPRDICAPTWGAHIFGDIRSPTLETHITSDMRSSAQGTHIPGDMCFPTQETHITIAIGSATLGTHITGNMCSQ